MERTYRILRRPVSFLLVMIIVFTSLFSGAVFKETDAADTDALIPKGFNKQFVQAAVNRLGRPYGYSSGQTDTGTYDCSHLVYWALTDAGFDKGSIPRYPGGPSNPTSDSWYTKIMRKTLALTKGGKQVSVVYCDSLNEFKAAVENRDNMNKCIVLRGSDYNGNATIRHSELENCVLSNGQRLLQAGVIEVMDNHDCVIVGRVAPSGLGSAYSTYSDFKYGYQAFNYLNTNYNVPVPLYQTLPGYTSDTLQTFIDSTAGDFKLKAIAGKFYQGGRLTLTRAAGNPDGTWGRLILQNVMKPTTHIYGDSTIWKIEAMSETNGVAYTNNSGAKSGYDACVYAVYFKEDDNKFYAKYGVEKTQVYSDKKRGGAEYAISANEAVIRDIAEKGTDSAYTGAAVSGSMIKAADLDSKIAKVTTSASAVSYFPVIELEDKKSVKLYMAEISAPTGIPKLSRNKGFYEFTLTGTKDTTGAGTKAENVKYYQNSSARSGIVVGTSKTNENGYLTAAGPYITDKDRAYAYGLSVVKYGEETTDKLAGAVYAWTENEALAKSLAEAEYADRNTAIEAAGSAKGYVVTGVDGSAWFAPLNTTEETAVMYMAECYPPDDYEKDKGYFRIIFNTGLIHGENEDIKVAAKRGSIREVTYFLPAGSKAYSASTYTLYGSNDDNAFPVLMHSDVKESKNHYAALYLKKKNDDNNVFVGGAIYALIKNSPTMTLDSIRSAADMAEDAAKPGDAVNSFATYLNNEQIVGYYVTNADGSLSQLRSYITKSDSFDAPVILDLGSSKEEYGKMLFRLVEVYSPINYERDGNIYGFELMSGCEDPSLGYDAIAKATTVSAGIYTAAPGEVGGRLNNPKSKLTVEGSTEGNALTFTATDDIKTKTASGTKTFGGNTTITSEAAMQMVGSVKLKLVMDNREDAEVKKDAFGRPIANDILIGRNEDWKYAWKDLLFADDAGEISYSVRESAVYDTNGNEISKDLYTITYGKDGEITILLNTPTYDELKGAFRVEKRDDAGNTVQGIKFDVYSSKDCNADSFITSKLTDESGSAVFNVTEELAPDTKWLSKNPDGSDNSVKVFYVRENKASAKEKNYKWNSSVYRVSITGDLSELACKVSVKKDGSDEELAVQDESGSLFYFVQKNIKLTSHSAVKRFAADDESSDAKDAIDYVEVILVKDGKDVEGSEARLEAANDFSCTWTGLSYYSASKKKAEYSSRETAVKFKDEYNGGALLDDAEKIAGYFETALYTENGVTVIENKTVKNELYGAFEVMKTDDANVPVPGIIFNVYADEALTVLLASAATGDDGSHIFYVTTDIIKGKWYDRDNYLRPTDTVTVFVQEDKSVAEKGYVWDDTVSRLDIKGSKDKNTAIASRVVIKQSNIKTASASVVKRFASEFAESRITSVKAMLYLKEADGSLIKVTKDANGKKIMNPVELMDKPDHTYTWKNLKYYNGNEKAVYVSREESVTVTDAAGNEKTLTGPELEDLIQQKQKDTETENKTVLLNDIERLFGSFGIYKLDDKGNPAEAEFAVYTDAECTDLLTTLKTTKDSGYGAVSLYEYYPGWSVLDGIDTRTFYVKEISADSSYVLYPYTIKVDVTPYAFSGKLTDAKVKKAEKKAEAVFGVLPLSEEDEAKAKENGFDPELVIISPQGAGYSACAYAEIVNNTRELYVTKIDMTTGEEIKGAELSVYKADEEGNITDVSPVDSWVSGSEGENEDGSLKVHIISGLSEGWYVLKEISAPTDHGYTTSADIKFYIEKDRVRTVREMKDDHTELVINKIELGSGKEGKAIEVSGALLTLIEKETEKEVLSFTTGPFEEDDITVSSEYESNGLKAYKRYNKEKELTDLVVEYIPIGKYLLRELQPATGYVTAADIEISIDDDKGVHVFCEATMEDDFTKIAVSKHDAKTQDQLKGAVLSIYKENAEGEAEGEALYSFVTDGSTRNIDHIPIGKYILREESAPYGFKKADDIHFEVIDSPEIKSYVVNDERIYGQIKVHKQDETGRDLEGVEFTITNDVNDDEIILVTDGEGNAKSGLLDANVYGPDGVRIINYTIKETKVPESLGVAISEEEHEFFFDCSDDTSDVKVIEYSFTDKLQKGNIAVYKKGILPVGTAQTGNAYGLSINRLVKEETFLPGAVYTVYSDEECTEEVCSVTTSKEGIAESEPLVCGTYYVKETYAPKGFAIDEEVHEVVIEGTESGPEITERATKELEDRLLSAKLTIKKKGKDANGEEKPLEGVMFGVFAGEDISNLLGDTVIEKDVCLALIKTDKDGIATMTESLPEGKYYYRELKTANDDYILDEKQYEFTVSYDESEDVNIEKEMINVVRKGTLVINKVDQNGNALGAGVEFLLERDDGEKTVLVTNGEGIASKDDLEIGRYDENGVLIPYVYTLKETKALDKYKLDGTVYTFSFTEENTRAQAYFRSLTITNEILGIKDFSAPGGRFCLILSAFFALGFVKNKRKMKNEEG